MIGDLQYNEWVRKYLKIYDSLDDEGKRTVYAITLDIVGGDKAYYVAYAVGGICFVIGAIVGYLVAIF